MEAKRQSSDIFKLLKEKNLVDSEFYTQKKKILQKLKKKKERAAQVNNNEGKILLIDLLCKKC